MDIFEYLPQLIVAYDGNDEFANLIHVKKANKDNNYFCPCCGGSVKPRALDSTKEQSHYYHVTGKCTKESQLHFFCKNWLFEEGSKFYVDDSLFEVKSIEIEKPYETPFGKYIPDVTVHTTDDTDIYFEMFFTNRKTGDDYFCKWDYLGNDVVEVDIKEYMAKTDADIIPSFTFLYHDGICYSKTYQKKDLYANTIAKIKHELTRQKVLNYKARIEQLDWFWQNIRNNGTRESILESLSVMEYDDLISCYDIIKRKQCVSYLKNDVINVINEKIISDVRKSLGLPYDENVYFDLEPIYGRTYKSGIRLKIQTEHIIYDSIYESYDEFVFSKNIYNINEIVIPETEIENLKSKFEKTRKYKEKIIKYEKELTNFEGNDYKIRMKNNLYTVLAKTYNDTFEVIIEDYYMKSLSIKILSKKIESQMHELNCNKYINTILNDETYMALIHELNDYQNMNCHVNIKYDNLYNPGIHFKLFLGSKILYDEIMEPNFDDFIYNVNCSKIIIDKIYKKYTIFSNLVDKINQCKNNFWKAEMNIDSGAVVIKIDQKVFEVQKYYLYTYEKLWFYSIESYTEKYIKTCIRDAMYRVQKNMERCGYRVMEVRD